MKETNSRSLGSRNRQKGHHAERFYADVFRELGYEHCITARLGGRIFDNAGIDIINIPFNIQIKAGKQKGLNAGKILFQMYSQINELFPPEHEVRTFPLFVIHRANPFSKSHEGDMLYMTRAQFLKYSGYPIEIEYYKKRKETMSSDFGEIVGVKFSKYTLQIIFSKNEEIL